jgi:uncharacterized protein
VADAGFEERYGPWALVTGASDGIGQAIARQLGARGLNVVLVARRKQRLDALAREIERLHGKSTRVIATDLAAPGAAVDAMRQTDDRSGAACRLRRVWHCGSRPRHSAR